MKERECLCRERGEERGEGYRNGGSVGREELRCERERKERGLRLDRRVGEEE